MAHFTGVNATLKEIEQELKDLEKQAIAILGSAAVTTVIAYQSITPVWSGETVRNYGVSYSGYSGGYSTPSGGDPGPTNSMPLGPENLRPENSAAAVSAVRSAMSGMNKLMTITIVNHVSGDKWNLIDSGSAPDKLRARYPGGVALLGESLAKSRLSGNFR